MSESVVEAAKESNRLKNEGQHFKAGLLSGETYIGLMALMYGAGNAAKLGYQTSAKIAGATAEALGKTSQTGAAGTSLARGGQGGVKASATTGPSSPQGGQFPHKANIPQSSQATGAATNAANEASEIPPRVQSRINLQTGGKSIGWRHVVEEHFSGKATKSQFTITQSELRQILQSKEVIQAPIKQIVESERGLRFIREVNYGRPIGLDKFSGNNPTSTTTIMMDEFGNLITAFPGRLQ